jgi:hypothetical protein
MWLTTAAVDASYLAPFGSLIGARGRYVAAGCYNPPDVLIPPFSCKMIHQYFMCCVDALRLVVPNLLLQHGHHTGIVFVLRTKERYDVSCNKDVVFIMLCSFLHNYLLHKYHMAMLLKTTYLHHQPNTGKVHQAECITPHGHGLAALPPPGHI